MCTVFETEDLHCIWKLFEKKKTHWIIKINSNLQTHCLYTAQCSSHISLFISHRQTCFPVLALLLRYASAWQDNVMLSSMFPAMHTGTALCHPWRRPRSRPFMARPVHSDAGIWAKNASLTTYSHISGSWMHKLLFARAEVHTLLLVRVWLESVWSPVACR